MELTFWRGRRIVNKVINNSGGDRHCIGSGVSRELRRGRTLLNKVLRDGVFEYRPRQVRKGDRWLDGVWAEGTASAKALGQEHSWFI